MALQLRTTTNKLINPVLNLVRYRHRHRPSFLPSLLWEDPFKAHRSLMADVWNRDPFETFFGPSRIAVFRNPALNWEDDSLIQNPKDGFKVSLDVQHFEPHEISVKVVDNCILVEAKHEERSEGDKSYVSRQFSRRYVLPEDYNIKDVVSTLSADGILTVKAPPKYLDDKNARKIEIQQTGTSHKPEEQQKVEGGQDDTKKE